MTLNISDEAIKKILAETMETGLNDLVLRSFLGSDHVRTTASGLIRVDWSSRAREQGTYTGEIGAEDTVGYLTFRRETVAEYRIPASDLQIEGKFTVIEADR